MELSKLARQRLKTLQDFFKTVPSKRVDLDTYARQVAIDKPMKYEDRLSLTKCKAVGCLLGWGTAVPSLRKAGLRLNDDRSLVEVASEVFDISEELAGDLFDSRMSSEDFGKKMNQSDKTIALARLKRVLKKGFDEERDSVFEDGKR